MQTENHIRARRFCTVAFLKIFALACAMALLAGLAPVRATAAVSGTKTALVMLVSFKDAPIDTTVAEVTGMVFTNTPLNVNSFYKEATWGAVNWAGDVINVSVDYYMTNCATDPWANAADVAARVKGFEPGNYTTRVYAFPSSGGSCGYAWAYGNRVVTFHGSDLFCYAHEMGHSIGLHHAVTDHNNDGVFEDAYGGKDDCMGGESYTFNAPHKIWGGWLPERPAGNGGWKQITTDGVYMISPLEINPTNALAYPQALKIVPPTGNPYFLSFRQPLGFDQGWTASQVGKDGRTGTGVDPVPPISANYAPYYYKYAYGVTIHRHSGGTGAETYEIAVLANNQQFTIPGTGIVIRQTAYDTSKVTLSITGFNGSSVPYGVTVFEDNNFGGAQSQVLTPGTYTLSQLNLKGVPNDWVSSCKVPPGLSLVLYQHDNFGGIAWTNNSDVAMLSSLSPSGADNQMSSCRIISTAAMPPSVPSDLAAVGSDAQVNVTWTPSPGATRYDVARSTVNGGPYQFIAAATLSGFVDAKVTNGVTYYYVVAAGNNSGTSAQSSAVSATPTSPLVAHWKFDEGSGTTTSDASGNRNTGTLVNSPGWVTPGKLGTAALTFNASSLRSVTAPSSSTLNLPTKAVTFSAWVYAFDWNGNRRILQKGNGDNQYRFLAENSVLKLHLSGVDELTTALPPVNAWVHLAGTWDGTTMAIYTNGVLQASKAATGVIPTTSDLLAIGKKNTSGTAGDYFNGRLDDVRIYTRALNAAELAAIMVNSQPAFTSNPVLRPNAQAGQAYASSLAGTATDVNNDSLTFSKLSGPAWLTVAPNGTLSGTPFSADAGLNQFAVGVTDGSGVVSGNLNITVLAAPSIVATAQRDESKLLLSWTGGIPPFQVQASTNFVPADWQTIADSISSNSFRLDPTNSRGFFRIQGR